MEKINHVRNQKRFYHLSVARTLFGEWSLTREWGRIGARGGQTLIEFFPSEAETLRALADWKHRKERKGYGVLPVQLSLPIE